MESGLPEGWTIERLRAESGDRTAGVLSLDRLVVVEERAVEGRGGDEYVVLAPDVILSFHALCLARAAGEWFMGELEDDGSIVCWASYGADLGEAVRGL